MCAPRAKGATPSVSSSSSSEIDVATAGTYTASSPLSLPLASDASATLRAGPNAFDDTSSGLPTRVPSGALAAVAFVVFSAQVSSATAVTARQPVWQRAVAWRSAFSR